MGNTTKSVENGLSNHSSTANSITTYIKNVRTMSKSTACQYLSRLNDFKDLRTDDHLSIDNLLLKIKKGNQDPYNILNGYAAYLRNCNVSALTLKQRIVTVKNFFEYSDIDISPRKFKLKIKLPKIVRKKKEALSKEVDK